MSMQSLLTVVGRYIQSTEVCSAKQGSARKGVHGSENVGKQRDIFCPWGPLYGVLRRLKVHLVQPDIFWLVLAVYAKFEI